MNRIDRLHAIVTQLQSKRIVKAQEIADRFEISIRTVYRDIRALEENGVPIGSEAGIGYFLADGYTLPPIMFTKNEANSLILTEKLTSHFLDKQVKSDFQDALLKVKSVLNMQTKEELADFEHQVVVEPFIKPSSIHHNPTHFQAIQNALREQVVVTIEYHANYTDQSTKRMVEPIGLCFYSSHWHLIAYCQLRNDYRDFRIDRIQQITLTSTRIVNHNKLTLEEYLNQLLQKTDIIEVTIRFQPWVLKFIENTKYHFGLVREDTHDNYTDMTFSVPELDYISRWLLMLGEAAEVLQPSSLIDDIKNHLQKLNAIYLKD